MGGEEFFVKIKFHFFRICRSTYPKKIWGRNTDFFDLKLQFRKIFFVFICQHCFDKKFIFGSVKTIL